MVTRVVALIALGLLAGCGGKDAPPAGGPLAAPPQQAARIASIRVRPGNPPRFALVTVGDDGSKLQVLVRAPRGGIQRLGSPAWSPDAERVYFVGVLGEREGDRFTYYESDAFVVGASGGEAGRVTTSRDIATAVPSPDGRMLLVARSEHPGERPFTSGLWLMDADGGNERRLLDAEDTRRDLAGSWSPDGRTIAFTRCRYTSPGDLGLIENTCGVYTASPDGSGLRKLAERSSRPAFSPDGRLIAFVSDRDEHGKHPTGSDEEAFSNELYVMDADGGNQRRLTESESLDEATPVWSPDGSRIAFAREGPARFSEQFDSPSWRPGRITGELAPLAC